MIPFPVGEAFAAPMSEVEPAIRRPSEGQQRLTEWLARLLFTELGEWSDRRYGIEPDE